MTSDYTYKGDKHKLACSYEQLATSVKPGQQILVADGSLVLTVLACDQPLGEITCRVENNAAIGERKNMNLPGVKVCPMCFIPLCSFQLSLSILIPAADVAAAATVLGQLYTPVSS